MSQEQQTVALIISTYIKKLNQIEQLRLYLSQLKSFYPEQGFYFLKNFEKILNLYQASQNNPGVMYNQDNYFLNHDQISNERMADGFILFRNIKHFLEFNKNYSVEEKIIGISLSDFTHTTSLAGINYDHFIKIFFPQSDYQARKRLMKMKCIYQNTHIFNKIEPMIQNTLGKILKKLIKLVQKAESLCLRLQSSPYFDPLFLFSSIDYDQKGFLCYSNISQFLTKCNFDAFTYDQMQGYNNLQTEEHIKHLQDEISFQQFQNLIYPKFPYYKEQTLQQQMANRSQFQDYSQLKTKTGVQNISNISGIQQSFTGNQSLFGAQSKSITPITNIEQLPKTVHKAVTSEDPYTYKYQILRGHNSHSPPKYISETLQLQSAKFVDKKENPVRYAAVDQYTIQESMIEKEGNSFSKHQVKEARMPAVIGNLKSHGNFVCNNQQKSQIQPVWQSQNQSQQLIHYTDSSNQEKYIDRTFLHFVGKQFVNNTHEKDELNSQLTALQRKTQGQDINNPNLYNLTAAEQNLISYLHPPEIEKNQKCRILRPNVQIQQDLQDQYLSTIKLSEPVQSSILKVEYDPVVNVIDQKYLHRIKNIHQNKLGIVPKEKKYYASFYQQPNISGYNNLAQNQPNIQQSQTQFSQNPIFQTVNLHPQASLQKKLSNQSSASNQQNNQAPIHQSQLNSNQQNNQAPIHQSQQNSNNLNNLLYQSIQNSQGNNNNLPGHQ